MKLTSRFAQRFIFQRREKMPSQSLGLTGIS